MTMFVSMLLSLTSFKSQSHAEIATTGTAEESPVYTREVGRMSPQSLDSSGNIPSIMSAIANTKRLTRFCQRDFVNNTRARSPQASPHLKKDLDDYVRAGLRAGISESQMRQTLAAYIKNQSLLKNQRYLSIIDYGKKSNQKRMHILDLRTGKIDSVVTAHGKGSDPSGSGRGKRFSNKPGSQKSSLGCMVSGSFYEGRKGKSMILHGLEPGKNDNSCGRSTVIHAASYVGGMPGRSWGCPAVRRADRDRVFAQLAGGALICAFNGDQK